MSVLLALICAAGVGLIWAGAVCELRLETIRRRPTGLPRLAPGLVALAVVLACLAAAAAWATLGIPVLALAAAAAGGYAPRSWVTRRRERGKRAREKAWPAALAQLADALEAGLAFAAAVSLAAKSGPGALRLDFATFHNRLRSAGLGAALDSLEEANERTSDTVALLLRAALLELPAGGLAPILRELAETLSEQNLAREKARSRASSLQLEASILAASPIALLLLIGAASPGYLDAYRTAGGTLVGLVGGLLIFGCYLMMRYLGRVPEPRRTRALR